MNYLRLLGVFLRTSLMGELAYRVNFFIQLVQSLLELGTALAGLAVVFAYTNALGGWRPDEMLALVGAASLLIIYKHKDNIRRLLAGTEHRFERKRGAKA